MRLRAFRKANTKLRSQEFALEPALGEKSARPLLVTWPHCAVFLPLALRGRGWMETNKYAPEAPPPPEEQCDIFLSLTP